MSRSKKQRLRSIDSAKTNGRNKSYAMTADGLVNLLGNLGTREDKASQTSYVTKLIDPYTLSSMFRTDWMSYKIVTIPAEDMTREWRTFKSDEHHEDIRKLVDAEKSFDLHNTIMLAVQWSRLYGGSAILIGVDDGLPMSEPLNIEAIKPGSLKFLRVVDKRYIYPINYSDVYNPASFNFMNPEFYSIANLQTQERGATTIHRSRLIRFDGVSLALQEYTANQFWGDSVLQHIYDVIANTGVVQSAIASLTFESNIDIVKIKNLREMLANEEGEEIGNRWHFARLMKSLNRMLLMDGNNEEYERKQINFAGLPEVFNQYLQVVSAAADIPATRLLGSSPDGMNATGDGDLRNYYDSIRSKQNNLLRGKLELIDKLICMHTFGFLLDDLTFEFNPLWQETPVEKSDRNLKESQTYSAYLDRGVLTPLIVAKQLKADRTIPAIDDEYIEEMEQIQKEEKEEDIPEDFNIGVENGTQSSEPDKQEAYIAKA